jgi:hypothetical protein
MAKYDPLFAFLCRAGDGPVTLGFDAIEQLVGKLPAKAATQRAWWSTHAADPAAHARSWVNAGREVETVDLTARQVTFGPAQWRRGA